ncbi:MAG: NAD(P)-dependent oxidoreductase [Pseudomonadota bacterium]
MPDTVLVTGGAGFIGRATLAALAARGQHAVGTYRGDAPPALDGVRWVKCDMSDRAAVAATMAEVKPSHLIALAWYMGPGNQQAVENFQWIGQSIDMLMDFAGQGGSRVIFCGSCMEYDWSREVKLSETETPLTPHTEYGAAKAALSQAFGSLCAKLGLSGAWARPFFLYGPGENPRRLAADVILSLLDGREALCTDGTQRRDFLHVGDVADAMVTLLDSDVTGPMNVGSGQAVPLKVLIEEIGRQTGRGDLIRLGAREGRPGDPPLVEADTAHLSGTLGWTPKFDLSTGIADTIDWWRRARPQMTELTS